jgi:hypothetical protein
MWITIFFNLFQKYINIFIFVLLFRTKVIQIYLFTNMNLTEYQEKIFTNKAPPTPIVIVTSMHTL